MSLEIVQKKIEFAESENRSRLTVNVEVLKKALVEASAPRRRVLPTRRATETQKVKIGNSSLYLSMSHFEDGSLAEIFLSSKREGSAFRSIVDAFAMLFSVALQYGIPVKTLVGIFKGWKFEPNGPVWGSENVSSASSILDYIAQEIETSHARDTQNQNEHSGT